MFNILLPTLKSIGNALPGQRVSPLSPAAEGEDWSYACKISLSDIKKDTALDERLRMGDLPEETSPYRWIASDAVAELLALFQTLRERRRIGLLKHAYSQVLSFQPILASPRRRTCACRASS